MKNGYTPVREKVIRANIDAIREALISRQLEAEYSSLCMQKLQQSITMIENELGKVKETENVSEENKSRIELLSKQLESAKESYSIFEGLINEHQSVEAGLIAKLDFYKSKREELKEKKEQRKAKREEKFIEESLRLLENAPEKINVDISSIDFKENKEN